MLIKCPECNKEISDKAPHCVYCGFPLNNICNTNIIQRTENVCMIDSKPFDLSEEIAMVLGDKPVRGIKAIEEKTGLSLKEAKVLGDIIRATQKIPENFELSSIEKYRERLNAGINPFIAIECPYCKSKATEKISDAKKSRAALFGAWGTEASKVMNQWHCVTCGSDF